MRVERSACGLSLSVGSRSTCCLRPHLVETRYASAAVFNQMSHDPVTLKQGRLGKLENWGRRGWQTGEVATWASNLANSGYPTGG